MSAVEDMMCVACVSVTRGHSGGGCDLASTLWNYDLSIVSCERVQRVRRRSISSELLICGGGVRSIFLLTLVARCLETFDVCILIMFAFMSAVVTLWGSVKMVVV